MSAITWGVSEDGRYEFASLSSETLNPSMEVMRKAFFMHENISKSVEIDKNPEAAKELEGLTLNAAKDGVSLIAIEKSTGKIVGGCFNKIQIPAAPQDANYFEEYLKNCKHPSSIALIRFMIEADAECDLFEHCNVDCILELMFLAVLKEHRGQKIGKTLVNLSLRLGRELRAGKNVKVTVHEGEHLDLEPIPKVAASIFTSNVTQGIGKDLGFEVAVQIEYERWSFEGRSFADRIGLETPKTSLEFYRL